MGAGQSKADQEDQGLSNEVPVQFSREVIDHLAEVAASPNPDAGRQSSLDAQIRARIHAELSRLRQEEEEVRREIELSLEKENLDHEARALGHGDDAAPDAETHKTLNSTMLLGDLEEVKQKVDKFRTKREDVERHAAGEAAGALSFCYRENATKPLECWREVANFKSSVSQLEQDYIGSLR